MALGTGGGAVLPADVERAAVLTGDHPGDLAVAGHQPGGGHVQGADPVQVGRRRTGNALQALDPRGQRELGRLSAGAGSVLDRSGPEQHLTEPVCPPLSGAAPVLRGWWRAGVDRGHERGAGVRIEQAVHGDHPVEGRRGVEAAPVEVGGSVGVLALGVHDVAQVPHELPESAGIDGCGGLEQDRLGVGHHLGPDPLHAFADHPRVPGKDGAGREGLGRVRQIRQTGRGHYGLPGLGAGHPQPTSQERRGRGHAFGGGITAGVEHRDPPDDLRGQHRGEPVQVGQLLGQRNAVEFSRLLLSQCGKPGT